MFDPHRQVMHPPSVLPNVLLTSNRTLIKGRRIWQDHVQPKEDTMLCGSRLGDARNLHPVEVVKAEIEGVLPRQQFNCKFWCAGSWRYVFVGEFCLRGQFVCEVHEAVYAIPVGEKCHIVQGARQCTCPVLGDFGERLRRLGSGLPNLYAAHATASRGHLLGDALLVPRSQRGILRIVISRICVQLCTSAVPTRAFRIHFISSSSLQLTELR